MQPSESAIATERTRTSSERRLRMLKPRNVVLGLALLRALIADSWGQSQHQLPNEATKAQQRAPTDERGTPDQPLTVNVVPTAEQKADADKEKESAKLKAADDRKLIEYTGYLVLVGVVQFGVFILQLITFSLQARSMRRAPDEMR